MAKRLRLGRGTTGPGERRWRSRILWWAALPTAAILGTVLAVGNGAQHLPVTVTDAAGQTTTYTYDDQGRVLTVESPPRMGLQPGESTPRALTQAERTTTFEYYPDDASAGAGQLKKITGPSTPQGSPVTTFEYNLRGNLSKETENGYALSYEYDALDRPAKVTYPDGTYEETQYNRLDAERSRDRLGRWSHQFHDALQRPAARRDPLGRTATFQWGSVPSGCASCGDLGTMVDPSGNTTTWEYDLEGRVKRRLWPDGRAAEFTYENTTGRLKQMRDAKGQMTTYDYFADGRGSAMNPKSVTYSNSPVPTPAVSYTYDPSYSRVTAVATAAGTTTYTYVPSGSLGAGDIATEEGPLPSDIVTYGYNEVGLVTSRAVNGVTTTLAYDALARMVRRTTTLGTVNYGYDGVSDRPTAISYPNGQTTTYTYYPVSQDSRLQEILHRAPDGSALSRHSYTYDAVGNVKAWMQQRGTEPATTWEYEYDLGDQLVAATLKTTGAPAAVLKRYRYAYDKAGNRSVEQIDDSATASVYDSRNRLVSQQPGGALLFAGTVSEPATVTIQGTPVQVGADNRFQGGAAVGAGTGNVTVTATDASGNTRTNTYQVSQSGASKTFTYDENGNLTSDGTRSFEWDAANRLVAVTSSSRRTEFGYDAWGRRDHVTDKVNGTAVSDRRFVWCGEEICEERDAGGATVTRRFSYEGMEEAGQTYFFARDHLGSIREVTDAAGSVVARYDYDPYGRISTVSGSDPVLGFTGHPYHGATGLDLTLYRAYDPTTAQWLSEDPMDQRDGWSRYAYTLGNPIRYYDSVGLQAGVPGGPGNGFPLCGGNCPHNVFTVFFNACRKFQHHPNVAIARCMQKKCQPKALQISCNSWPCQAPGVYAYTPLGSSVVLCPGNITNSSGPNQTCLERVLIHEIVLHACRPGGPTIPGHTINDPPSQQIKSLVPCPP